MVPLTTPDGIGKAMVAVSNVAVLYIFVGRKYVLLACAYQNFAKLCVDVWLAA